MARCTCTTGAGGLTDPSCPIHGVAHQEDNEIVNACNILIDAVIGSIDRLYGSYEKGAVLDMLNRVRNSLEEDDSR